MVGEHGQIAGVAEEDGKELTLAALPDELVVAVVRFLGARDLMRWGRVYKKATALPVDDIWRDIAAARWDKWPRYKLTAEREEKLNISFDSVSWRDRYLYFEFETRRCSLGAPELETMSFHFNFTPPAGGRGQESLRGAYFSKGSLFIPEYPPLPYILLPSHPVHLHPTDPPDADSDDTNALRPDSRLQLPFEPAPNSCHALLRTLKELRHTLAEWELKNTSAQKQQLLIANFPLHEVSRFSPEMEWVVSNDNVTVVSCHEGHLGSFDRNGFLTVPAPPPEPAFPHHILLSEED